MRGYRQGRALRTVGVILGALGAGFVTAAPAVADVEPNNVISQAEGPVGGGAPILGALSTPDDVDYFVFYAASQQQLHLTADDLTNAPGNDCLRAGFEDTNGASVANDYTTPPGVNRFFIHVEYRDGYSCNNPMSYRVEVDPGSGVSTGPALDHALTQTGEPNETPGQAGGPLSALVNYVGAVETTNDEDWFYFYVPPGTHQLDVSTTAPTVNSYCDASIELFGSASSSNSLQSATAGWSTFGHINQTLTGPAQYFLRAGVDSSNCLGSRWQFRIETPDAVTQSNPFPPPPPPPPPSVTPPTRYATFVSLRRRGARYSGKLTSRRAGCKVGRRVVLRRKGSGSKSFGVTHSRGDGTFTIQLSHRLRGRVYMLASQRTTQTVVCGSGRSSSIRG